LLGRTSNGKKKKNHGKRRGKKNQRKIAERRKKIPVDIYKLEKKGLSAKSPHRRMGREKNQKG